MKVFNADIHARQQYYDLCVERTPSKFSEIVHSIFRTDVYQFNHSNRIDAWCGKSSYPEHNLRQVENFISRLQVLDYGTNAAAHYGDIRASLERIGKPIGVNDFHIAGHARSEDLVLVTNNLVEFEQIEGLKFRPPDPG